MILQITTDERIREVSFCFPVSTQINGTENEGMCKQHEKNL